MRTWSAERVADEAGADLLRGARAGGPGRAVVDSREAGPGDLFVGLVGEHVDGGEYAARALEAGAWGVLVAPEHARDLPPGGAVLASPAPLTSLQALARGWRRALGAAAIGITGSVGKTSTKDLVRALIAPHRRVHASRANFNTEIGLPLELLAAPPGTEVLVLEMGMRGAGQIAELAAVAEPEVGVITALGPVHLELLGSMDAIARAKAELLARVRVAVVPAGETRLDPYLPPGVEVVRFGDDPSALAGLELPVASAHMRRNAQAAVAAARAVGVEPSGPVELELSAMRGQVVELADGVTVVEDCYNANPLSMHAALDDLSAQSPPGRRIAVLGDMLELGPDERALHREIGAHAAASGVDVLVAVGPLAADMVPAFGGEASAVADADEAATLVRSLVAPGDLVLVKASRGVRLEAVTRALAGA
ncbi:MAG: UDP-N-acetylmuramoyl-tripeptide--D-alanyl-D-alanine ligase [Solirubrobacteraceae bacterium]